MIKRISTLIMLFAFIGFVVSACSPSPETAAKEACECMKKQYEAQKASDEAAKEKLSKEAEDCIKKIDEKYKDKANDKEFQDAFMKEFEKCQKEIVNKAMEENKTGE